MTTKSLIEVRRQTKEVLHLSNMVNTSSSKFPDVGAITELNLSAFSSIRQTEMEVGDPHMGMGAVDLEATRMSPGPHNSPDSPLAISRRMSIMFTKSDGSIASPVYVCTPVNGRVGFDGEHTPTSRVRLSPEVFADRLRSASVVFPESMVEEDIDIECHSGLNSPIHSTERQDMEMEDATDELPQIPESNDMDMQSSENIAHPIPSRPTLPKYGLVCDIDNTLVHAHMFLHPSSQKCLVATREHAMKTIAGGIPPNWEGSLVIDKQAWYVMVWWRPLLEDLMETLAGFRDWISVGLWTSADPVYGEFMYLKFRESFPHVNWTFGLSRKVCIGVDKPLDLIWRVPRFVAAGFTPATTIQVDDMAACVQHNLTHYPNCVRMITSWLARNQTDIDLYDIIFELHILHGILSKRSLCNTKTM